MVECLKVISTRRDRCRFGGRSDDSSIEVVAGVVDVVVEVEAEAVESGD